MTSEIQIRRCARVVNGGTPTSDEVNWDGDMPWATPEDLGLLDGSILYKTRRSLTALGIATSNANAVPAGAIIVSTRAPIGHLAIAALSTSFNQGCRALVPLRDTDSRFLYYALLASRRSLQARGRGSTFTELSSEQLSSFKILLPDSDRQRLIADFLDLETQRIDALVGAKRQMIDLLEEKRSAIRDKALGSLGSAILAPLKRRADVTVGIVVQPARLYTDDGVPVLRGLNVGEGDVSRRGLRFISEKANREHSKSILRDGDVVVVRTGQAGAAAVVPSWAVGGNCVDLLLVRPSPGLNSKYLEYWLNSSLTAHQVEKFSVGAIQSHYNVGALRELLVAVPSLAQQQTTVDELGRREGAIKKAVSTLSTQIALLAEYRQALITKAVTGELDEATLKGEKPADEVVEV